jgi:acyl-CoA synthetase (AMP-forming)/AMP-acid ligase II
LGNTSIRLAPSFLLVDHNDIVHTAEEIILDARRIEILLKGYKKLTIEAHHPRAVLIGLLIAQYYKIEVMLSREKTEDAILTSERLEFVPGVFGWLDKNSSFGKFGSVGINSSGTTGKAKIAYHSLDRLSSAVSEVVDGKNAIWLLTYEPASFAGVQVILTAAINGARLLAPHRNIRALSVALISVVTHVSATPSFWRAMLAAIPADLSVQLKVITLGGEVSTQNLLDALLRRFPTVTIRHIYASTEAGVGFIVADLREGFPVAWLQEGVKGVQLRILNGELEIRTPRSMLSNGNGNNLKQVDWISTGDLVEVMGNRVLFQGRIDSVVNIGGTKVLPDKVEAILSDVEGVVDIAIIAHPNPILGYVLIGQVCMTPGADHDLVEFALKAKAIEKLPPLVRPIRYRFVDNLLLASWKKGRKNAT